MLLPGARARSGSVLRPGGLPSTGQSRPNPSCAIGHRPPPVAVGAGSSPAGTAHSATLLQYAPNQAIPSSSSMEPCSLESHMHALGDRCLPSSQTSDMTPADQRHIRRWWENPITRILILTKAIRRTTRLPPSPRSDINLDDEARGSRPYRWRLSRP